MRLRPFTDTLPPSTWSNLTLILPALFSVSHGLQEKLTCRVDGVVDVGVASPHDGVEGGLEQAEAGPLATVHDCEGQSMQPTGNDLSLNQPATRSVMHRAFFGSVQI